MRITKYQQHVYTHAIFTHRSKLMLHSFVSISIWITEFLLFLAGFSYETAQSSSKNFRNFLSHRFAPSLRRLYRCVCVRARV